MSKTVFINGKGGVGKTTTSFNLANGIKNSMLITYDSTANFDFIQRQREDSKMKKHNLKELAFFQASYSSIDEDTDKVVYHDLFEESLEIIKAEEEETNQEIHSIYDMGGYDTSAHRKIMALADNIIIPTGLDEIELQSLATIAKTLENISKDLKRKVVANVLPTRIHHRVEKTSPRFKRLIEEVAKYDNLFLMDSIVEERGEFRKAMSLGCSVLELPSTRASRGSNQIKALITELNLPKNK